jgi:hypothetical protein
MVSISEDELSKMVCLYQPEDDKDEDDKFPDGELDFKLAKTGEGIQLLHDCAVREAVTYGVCDLVDKVIQKMQLPTTDRRIQMYSFFKKRLCDKFELT